MKLLQVLMLTVASLASLGAAQIQRIEMAPVTVRSESTCPTAEQRQNTTDTIRKSVQLLLFNRSYVPQCGSGQWYRVTHLDMTDPTQQCPSVWREYNTNGVRACGRPSTGSSSQPGLFYPTSVEYRKVCGRAIGFQVATPDAFIDTFRRTIDQVYMDGLSITYGSPRQHIWSFVAGVTDKQGATGPWMCPCVNPNHPQNVEPQSFVGNDYYCESGKESDSYTPRVMITEDPIWDGQNCDREGECCGSGKTPPWFSVQLSSPSTDDIEVRILGDESTDNEDTPIQILEIFVQ